jgi:hypothetical protein
VFYPKKIFNRTESFVLSRFPIILESIHLINTRASSSHVGPTIRGVVSKEEKAEQEIPRGSQATNFKLNPEQGKPLCIQLL